MVKYKLKSNPINEKAENHIQDYLISLGVEKPESFIIGPTKDDEEDYNKLENIQEAIEVLNEAFTREKKIFLQVDSDADGFTSSAIFYSYFKSIYPEARIEFRLHEGKEHGIILDTIPIDADYIVVPDAGSMQFDEQKSLSDRGYKVVILDHHRMEFHEKIENVVIVNNQNSPEFKNKFLSGAGIVYKTIQAYADRYCGGNKSYENYADLAAIGIISDMMDTRELDNNFIIRKGLANICNPMIRALVEKQGYSISNIMSPNKIDIAFYISPIINGVIRFGSYEEKYNLFNALVTYDSNEMIETTYHGNTRKEHFYDFIARTSYNVKERQNREKLKSMEYLSEKIEKEGLHHNQLLIVTASIDDVPQTITGLVAMELLKKYKKPTLVLRPKSDGDGGTKYAGSGRAKANGDFDSLFEFLKDSGLCEFVAGHDMAHGVGVSEENLPKLIEYANENLSHIYFDIEEVEVDFIFNNFNINRTMLLQFGAHIDIYGNGIPQPKFAFELKVKKEAFRTMGKNSDSVRFTVNGVDFIKFKDSELVDKIASSSSDILDVKVVGRAQINEWQGKKTPQIMVDEYSIEEVKVESLF